MKTSLLTGGNDPSYALPLLSGIISQGLAVDFIGNDEMQHAEAAKHINVNYLNLRGDQNPHASIKEKFLRLFKYYFRLIKYAYQTDSKLFHILWLNKFEYFDRTILNIYFKMLGKKIIFTAHNVNAGERDKNDSFMNRLTLMFMYKIVDHIFVHTEKMKTQLNREFRTRENKITVIPFGINNFVPSSNLTRQQAREKLNLLSEDRVILFFGRIARYKGLDLLLSAFDYLKKKKDDTKLIIAGSIKKGNESYWENINKTMYENDFGNNITINIDFIPDDEVEIYYKAADVLILPYRHIFQTGVMFLSYNFGLPVIATDVGSLREEVIEGETGFICQPEDPEDLAKKIDLYFHSNLYKNLDANRDKIIKYANEKYSWEKIGEETCAVYKSLL